MAWFQFGPVNRRLALSRGVCSPLRLGWRLIRGLIIALSVFCHYFVQLLFDWFHLTALLVPFLVFIFLFSQFVSDWKVFMHENGI